MKRKSLAFCFCLLLFFTLSALTPSSQREKTPAEKDVAIYVKKTQEGKETTSLSLDFSKIKKPGSPQEFKQCFHFPPIRQYKTGTCWCFAATSFFESELKRLFNKEIKLSEMYTVYWEYVEKARRFIREKGNSALGEGSEPNAVIERMKKYGAVRESDYGGLPADQKEHDHSKLFQEFKNYLEFCKQQGDWDEERTIVVIKSILDKHLGKPPETITVDGKTMTPNEYLENVLRLPLNDYLCFMSFKYIPFYTKGEYKVPDNWWHSQDYHNIPLPDFYRTIVKAIEKGFTAAIAADISEPGNSGENNIAIIPTFDIPRPVIDQDSREFRFDNKTSTDDHSLHLVGYKEAKNPEWFLIKDSWETAYLGKDKGYFFYRDDYLKLKVLVFMVHKDAVSDLLKKFK
jgi:bleomycin hydrolase